MILCRDIVLARYAYVFSSRDVGARRHSSRSRTRHRLIAAVVLWTGQLFAFAGRHAITSDCAALCALMAPTICAIRLRVTCSQALTLSTRSQSRDKLTKGTGETLTQAVITALRERLERSRPAPDDDDLGEDVLRLADSFLGSACSTRTADEIVGYDEHGVPSYNKQRAHGNRHLCANRRFYNKSQRPNPSRVRSFGIRGAWFP
jgi:antitoxin VapB